MKVVNEPEKYFVIREFEEGWGMDDVECEEQIFDYLFHKDKDAAYLHMYQPGHSTEYHFRKVIEE